MSLIHLEKQGDHWRSRVEGHFILGAHPIETARKGLPEAMAQAVVDHCAMSGGDAMEFMRRFVREINALAPVAAEPMPALLGGHIMQPEPAEPRRARVPRKAAAVAPQAEPAPEEPV